MSVTVRSYWGEKETVFTPAAFDGGGYMMQYVASDDGLTHLCTYDSGNAYIKDTTTGKWLNAFSRDRIPAAYRSWGFGSIGLPIALNGSCGLDVCATVSTRVWGLVITGNGIRVWRSDDRCASWNDCGLNVPAAYVVRNFGLRIACDPHDPDTCIFSDAAGVVRITHDAGQTWTVLNASGQPLAGILPSAATTAAVNSGTTLTFSAVPAAVTGIASGFTAFVSDITTSTAIPTGSATVVSSTSTTVTIGNSSIPASPGVGNGDIIVFGSVASIAFDRSGGVDGNGRTKNIYIGWSWGAAGLWKSADAATSFSQVSGGPAQIATLRCSLDGVLYVIDYISGSNYTNTQNAWKLQVGTWTQLSITGSVGNVWSSVAADPLNPGHVAFAMIAGNLQFSGDYCATFWSAASNRFSNRIATDVPWMGPSSTSENWASNGSLCFDPVVSGKLHCAEGIGVWWTVPVANSGGAAPVFNWTSETEGAPSLIVNDLCKVPDGNLLPCVWDRVCVPISDLTVEPSGPQVGFGVVGGITHAWAAYRAEDNSGFIAMIVAAQLWTSTDGNLFSLMASQPPTFFAGAVAAQSANSIVLFPSNQGTPCYWNGTSWQNCLFNGATLSTGWSFAYYLNRHNVVADTVSTSTYYAYNYDPTNGGLWKSTDGGANWTLVAARSVFTTISGIFGGGSDNFQMESVPGHQGHLFIGSGAGSGGAPLIRSIDGGATWPVVPGVSGCWQVSVGKEKSGAPYPAIYFTGTVSTDLSAAPGVFAADNVSATDTAATPKFIRLASSAGDNLDIPKVLRADRQTYRAGYLGMGGTGVVGFKQAA